MEVLDESQYGEFRENTNEHAGILHQELKIDMVYP
jgi:hypothetical protein